MKALKTWIGIILLVLVVILSYSFFYKWHLYNKYGAKYNLYRKQNGIPQVNRDMKIIRYGDSTLVFTNGVDSSRAPYHLRKILRLKKDKILVENDQFFKYLGGNTFYNLDLEYTVENKKWTCFLEKYYTDNPIRNRTRYLTLQQTDSVLNSWGLSR